MKTISELNSRWWYRGIKVLYFLLFAYCILLYPVSIFNSLGPVYDNENSYLLCKNGKKFYLSEYDIFLASNNLMNSNQDNEAQKLCFDGVKKEVKGTDNGFFGSISYQKIVSETENSGKYELISVYVNRDWVKSISFSLIAFLEILLCFEFVRRVFYYIVLGKIKPKL